MEYEIQWVINDNSPCVNVSAVDELGYRQNATVYPIYGLDTEDVVLWGIFTEQTGDEYRSVQKTLADAIEDAKAHVALYFLQAARARAEILKEVKRVAGA